jgi:hypothetical protein
MYVSSQNVNEQIIINEGPLKVTCFFKNYINIIFFGFSHLACRTLYDIEQFMSSKRKTKK